MKSQDLMVALKLTTVSEKWTYAALSQSLLISTSEIHAAVKRLQAGGLVAHGTHRVLRRRLLDFLQYGLNCVFPAQMGTLTRGEPTAWAVPELSEGFVPSDVTPVWPDVAGKVRGNAVAPLHPSAPKVARSDAQLHKLLALVDMLRLGRARDRKAAMAMLEVATEPAN